MSEYEKCLIGSGIVWCREKKWNCTHKERDERDLYQGLMSSAKNARRSALLMSGDLSKAKVQQWCIIWAGKTYLNVIIIGCKVLEKLRGLNCYYSMSAVSISFLLCNHRISSPFTWVSYCFEQRSHKTATSLIFPNIHTPYTHLLCYAYINSTQDSLPAFPYTFSPRIEW